jgi:crossover junction endonuclease MUS81
MLIRIDNREQDLIKLVNQSILTIPSFKELKVNVENLPLGDIILSQNEDDKVIIERKSINDLLSSIKDGRYEEQSYRLNGLEGFPNHNIIYLIEGDVNKINNMKNERMTAYSAMFSLNYYKGFSVFRTFTIEETALFICNTAAKILKTTNKSAYYQIKMTNFKQMKSNSSTIVNEIQIGDLENKSEQDTDHSSEQDIAHSSEQDTGHNTKAGHNTKDYISVIKKVKKDNITPDNIAEIMLCQIPGISATTAISIMEKYKTLSALISALETDPNCLNNVYNINSKGQLRKINKTCTENIVKFLLQKKM